MARVAGPAGPALGVALTVALAIALGGCGAVETWRSLSGIDRNDPDPQTALFTGNLAAGEAAPYPNLASVPPPPTRATTTEERQKLTQSLVADRNRAEADAGPPLAAAAAPRPKPGTATPSPTAAAATQALPAQAPVAGAAPGRTATNAPQPGGAQLGATQSGRRKADEPPEPGPPDSNLQMPQVRLVPEPETARPAPPAPALATIPRSPAATAGAEKLPEAVANLMPEPAPPVPVLEPVAPPLSGDRPDSARKPEPKRAAVATTVATLEIPTSATASAAGAAPSGPDRAQIERVAALYKDQPATVRVVGYAAGPAAGGGADPLASYQAALGRAQGVARALADSGIPAGKIQTEAAPASGARGPGRVEIQFVR